MRVYINKEVLFYENVEEISIIYVTLAISWIFTLAVPDDASIRGSHKDGSVPTKLSTIKQEMGEHSLDKFYIR